MGARAACLWACGNSRAGSVASARPSKSGGASRRRARLSRLALLVALAGAGCGEGPAPVPPAAPYEDSGSVEAGGFRLRYALTPTSDLPATIAGIYGIEPRRNLALLVLTLERRDAPPGSRIGAQAIEAYAVTLTGARTRLALARHDDPGGPTWLAPVELLHRVPITIEIRARATQSNPLLRARITREFRLE